MLFECLEFSGIAEELRDSDQQVVKEVLHLIRVGAKQIDIVADAFGLRHLNAPLHPAQESVLLVAVEVVSCLVAQDGRDGGERARNLGK